MKKIRITCIIYALAMTIYFSLMNFMPATEALAAIDPNTIPQGSVAYTDFYGRLNSRYCSFIDGISLGIKDTNDPLYYELVNLDGLDGRKQYNANTTYINVDEIFYSEEDTEFLVNIYYYDFGPSEGKYYVEYYKTDGLTEQFEIIKPGRNPGWTYASAVLTECDLSKHYSNGASLRIQNGAFNAFRRVEIVNLSECRREKKDITGIVGLRNEKIRNLEHENIVSVDTPMFSVENMVKQCNLYDVTSIVNKYKMTNTNIPTEYKERLVTQGELLQSFMRAAGVDYSKEASIVDFAFEIGFVANNGLFLFDDAAATYYNLVDVMEDMLAYKSAEGVPFIAQMYENGFFGDAPPSAVENAALSMYYYKSERLNPYITITDNGTGRSFKYINFFGSQLNRPYLTAPQWLHDGKRFLCVTPDNYIYIYNIETQMMRFLDIGASSTDGLVGEDGMIYYHTYEGSLLTLNRVDPDDPNLEGKVIYRFPPGVYSEMEVISSDGTWFAGDIKDSMNYFNAPEGMNALLVFYIPEESQPGVPDTTYKVQYYRFPEAYKGYLDHRQVNPVYDNLLFFAHDAYTSVVNYNDISDRVNIMNMDTGEVMTYNQGNVRGGKPIELATHESWSVDGEYLYFVSWTGNASKNDQYAMPALVRINKDGTHRQYYHANSFENSFNHCFASSNMKWIAFDEAYVGLMNAETHQLFPIAQSRRIIGSKSHPYHPHAQIARGHNIISWGYEYLGVLGVAWYDFDHIENEEIAKGGRYDVNEYVECVSYETLECESFAVEKDARNCQYAKAGKNIFYAINPDIADTTDDAIRITFDYLDNSKDPIVINYTSGVKYKNDARVQYDASRSISRRGSGEWKRAAVEIDSANCESIGKFESDFKISGGSANVYIANIKVENLRANQ